MIKKLSLVGAAVVAAMAAAPSMALPIASANESTPGVVKVVLSGSSAFQAAFESELSSASSSICDNSAGSTYNKYTASVTGGAVPGIAAYSCTSKPGLLASQKPLIITYRSEGGSVYGITPVVRPSAQVLRLALTATCGASTCPVGSGYSSAADTLVGQTANAVNSATDLGLSDAEAGMFIGANYPSQAAAEKLNVAPLTSGLTDAEITTLNSNSTGLVLQSFGIFTRFTVGAGVGTAADQFNNVGSLSRQVIGEIFKGTWTDWNQVPRNDGSNTTVVTGGNSLPIFVCRREAGSGTQTTASIFFLNTNCPNVDAFVRNEAGFSGNLDPTSVFHATSTGNMRTCIDTHAGAIGIISAEADTATHKMIKIDGKGSSDPLTNNLGRVTSSGDYPYAFEVVGIKRQGIAGSETGTVVDALVSAAQDQAKGPNAPNVSFLPVGPNAGVVSFPLNTTTNPGKQPVSCFSRGGNSCNLLADAC